MNVLAFSHSPPATGSDTSIRRITAHIAAGGHEVVLKREWSLGTPSLERLIGEHRFDLLVGTHAYYSGRVFVQGDIPYVLVLSGTDLNELLDDRACRRVMDEAIASVTQLVTYDDDFRSRCARLWPTSAAKTAVVPKGVATAPSAYSLRRQHGLEEARVMLLPAGLRPVKDVLFLADGIDHWYREDPRIRLVIVGLPRDIDYARAVYRRCASSPALLCLDPLPPNDLHAAMRESDVVVNSSRSECCANAILEAMDIGVPVIARDVPGNRSLVDHGRTGLLFGTPAEFVDHATRLFRIPTLRETLTRHAKRMLRARHTLSAERAAYMTILGELEACAA